MTPANLLPDSWIIGSAATCDLWVGQPAVSARHCQLVRRGDGFVVTDLGSTNGTYVDGRRISGPTPVTAHNRVTLGQSVAMAWPAVVGAQQVVNLGRQSPCEFVLDHPAVSARHGRMIVSPCGGLVVEDLGSTNGIRVQSTAGLSDRLRRAAIVQPGDVLHLGSAQVPVRHLLSATGAPSSVRTVTPNSVSSPVQLVASGNAANPRHGSGPPRPAVTRPSGGVAATSLWRWIGPAIPAVVFLVIVMVWQSRSGRPDPDDLAPDAYAATATGPPITPSTSTTPTMAIAPSTATRSGTGSSPAPSPEALATDDPLEQALFRLVVQTEDHRHSFSVGTAWLDGPDRLLTTASVLQSMSDMRAKDYPHAIAVHLASGREHSVIGLQTHPDFESRWDEITRVEQELQQWIRDNPVPDDPDAPPPADPQTLERWKQTGVEQLDRQLALVGIDVASIDITPAVDARFAPLTLATDATIRPNQRLRMLASGIEMDDLYFDSALPVEFQSAAWKIQSRIASGDGPARVILTADVSLRGQNYFGSPVVDPAGRVVTAFSILSPADPKPTQPDATLIEGPVAAAWRDIPSGNQP